jgi:hypothetical protein
VNPEEYAQTVCSETNVRRLVFVAGPVERADGTRARLDVAYTAAPYFERHQRQFGTFDLELDGEPQGKPDLARKMFAALMPGEKGF